MKLTQEIVDKEILKMTGRFHVIQDLGRAMRVHPDSEPTLREYVRRSPHAKRSSSSRDGFYDLTDLTMEEVKWWDGSHGEGMDLRLPMGLHEYCVIMPGDLIAVAGVWNQGKTAFLLNVVNLNMDDHDIVLFLTEGTERLKNRMSGFGHIPTPPPFKTFRRTNSFEDVIFPNKINIIDYLKPNVDNFSEVQAHLEAINNKLKKGVAFVAMQKPPGRDLAFGKDMSAFEPQLYISIDRGKLSFTKVKEPIEVDGRHPEQYEWLFHIEKGVHFRGIERQTR